jgi:two-component sensor histidine kinase/PAS domain-containing protein
MDTDDVAVKHALQFLPGLQIGTYEWWPAKDELTWSPELVGIYGLDRAPRGADEFVRHIYPDDRVRVEGETSTLLAPAATSYSHTFRILRPDGTIRVILDRGLIERDANGTVKVLRGVNVDVTGEAHLNYSAEVRLKASEDRYRKLFEAIDEGFCVIELRFDTPDGRADYRVVEANPAFYLSTSFPEEILGQWLRAAVPELEESWYEIYGEVARTRQPRRFENYSDLLKRWFDVYAFPVDDPKDNRVAILFGDISERKQREADAQLIVDEISHRSKNMLGIVEVIARQTANAGTDEFLSSFGNRIRAMAASHDLLVRNAWGMVSVSDLVRSQLLPFADLVGKRISLAGPTLSLTPVTTKSLGMALHELATNAAKYGALSNAEGRVEVEWAEETDGAGNARFALAWRESGGPPVAPPARKGFGSKVTTWMVEANTGGKVAVDYAAEGLVWRFEAAAAGVLA